MAEPSQKSKVKLVCPVCGKSVGSAGSLTAWIFQEQRCTCANAGSEAGGAIDENHDFPVSQPIEGFESAWRDDPTIQDGGAEGVASGSQTGDMIGRTIGGHYQILSCVGAGGMSVVYKAKHIHLGKFVALKLILPGIEVNQQAIRRFQQEGRAATALNHPNVARVSEFGVEAEKHPYLVMDFVEGTSLAEEIARSGPMSAERAASIVVQICQGLEHAHAKGVVHRDIKPGNIILCKEGEREDVPKIVDFGIAKATGGGMDGNTANLTSTGEVFGSPTYMSPEQCRGKAPDHRTDLYSLGCVLYELIAGEPPFRGTNVLEILNKHISEDPPALKGVPKHLQLVVFRALEKDANHRFQTATEVKKELERFLEGGSARLFSRLIGPSNLRKQAANRKAMGLFGMLGLFALVVVGAAVVLLIAVGVAIYAPSQHFDRTLQTSWIWQKEKEPRRKFTAGEAKQFANAIAFFRKFPAPISKSKDDLKSMHQQIDVFSRLIESSTDDWERPVDELVTSEEDYFPSANRYEELRPRPAPGQPTFRHWFLPGYDLVDIANETDPEMAHRLILEKVWQPVNDLIAEALGKVPSNSPVIAGRLHVLLGDCFYHMNNFEKAESEYGRAITILKPLDECRSLPTSSDFLRSLERRADCNYFLLKFGQAKAGYEEMLEAQTPDSRLARQDYLLSTSRLADCCRMERRYDDALMRYKYLHFGFKQANASAESSHRLAGVDGRRSAYARLPISGNRENDVAMNQAMCSLYMAYINSLPNFKPMQAADPATLYYQANEEIVAAFGRLRYLGVVEQMMSNIEWNNGNWLEALDLRYTAFCIRWDTGLPAWDNLPLYKRITPTNWESVTNRRKEQL